MHNKETEYEHRTSSVVHTGWNFSTCSLSSTKGTFFRHVGANLEFNPHLAISVSAKRETRIKWLMSMIPRYFLSSPFRYKYPPSEAGVAFDVTLCPLADYFKDQGVPELTQHAACNLDYCLARELGVDSVRTQTIADGAAHCDFRWNSVTYPE